MTTRGPSFHYFPLLPPELRLEIWKYCLPSRIVEVHEAFHLTPLPGQRFDIYQQAPSIPSLPLNSPIISRVCREARYFALSHGGFQPIGLKHMTVCFDKRTDIISIDPEHLSLYLIREEGVGVLLRREAPILMKCLSDPTIPLAIGSHLVERAEELPFLAGDKQKAQGITQWAVEFISQRTECIVVLDKASVHDIDHSDACACGLWGILAESNPAHVDVQDVSLRLNFRRMLPREFPPP
ncbi:hypothetical protein F4680DRAFT_466728 [Xylaria scruposa]|nr:hypothetical protein F4680DRAFT_466728 [Xylaria scruposa]